MSHRGWNWLIVAAAVLLVLGPISWGQVASERARWHLAAASNALELQGTEYQSELAKATALVDDVTSLRDYWLFRIDQALKEDMSSVPNVLAEAKAANEGFASLGVHAVQKITSAHAKSDFSMFPLVIQVIELIQSAEVRAKPDNLNQLAYFRSIVAIDLDRALEDIDMALEHFPKRVDYRDTRGWILFQMGRPIEALEDAQYAVETYGKNRDSGLLGPFNQLSRSLFPQASENYMEGVMRFHRGKILESLGRTEEAKNDWDWLELHDIPIHDQLY